MNKLLLILGTVIIEVSTFLSIQSCDSDDTMDPFTVVAESNEFIDFSESTNVLFESFLGYTNSLTEEEFDNLMLHIDDEEYIADLMERANLEQEIEDVKKKHIKLLRNKEYMDLEIDQQINLFKHDSEKRLKILLETKAGATTADECIQRKLDDYAWAQTTAQLAVIGCTCMAEVVVAACVCYSIAMVNYANDIRLAERAYEDCMQTVKP